MKNLIWLGLPWLIERFGFSKTKVFSLIAAAAGVYMVFAGLDSFGVGVMSWAGAGALYGLREAWASIKLYIPVLDKLLEDYTGYKELDKIAAELDRILNEAK